MTGLSNIPKSFYHGLYIEAKLVHLKALTRFYSNQSNKSNSTNPIKKISISNKPEFSYHQNPFSKIYPIKGNFL
ncbi:MAG: hypothetical protein ACK4J0_03175 [Candidatus Anstonellaceae archaeon]